MKQISRSRILSAILLALLTVVLSSCRKIEGPGSDLFGTWEVNDFLSIESVAYPKDPNNKITLKITEDRQYQLRLDINTCQGEILSLSDKGIIFGLPACTEACCDSPFSQKLSSMLPGVSMYDIQDDTLRLYVPEWGFIECTLVN